MKKVLFTLAALFAFGFAYAQTDAPVMQFCDAEGNQLTEISLAPGETMDVYVKLIAWEDNTIYIAGAQMAMDMLQADGTAMGDKDDAAGFVYLDNPLIYNEDDDEYVPAGFFRPIADSFTTRPGNQVMTANPHPGVYRQMWVNMTAQVIFARRAWVANYNNGVGIVFTVVAAENWDQEFATFKLDTDPTATIFNMNYIVNGQTSNDTKWEAYATYEMSLNIKNSAYVPPTPQPVDLTGQIVFGDVTEDGLLPISYDGDEEVTITVTLNGEPVELTDGMLQLIEGENIVVVTVSGDGYNPISDTYETTWAPTPPEPVQTPAPVINIIPGDEAYIIEAVGEGVVTLFIDEQEVENPYTVPRTDADQSIKVTAVAHVDGQIDGTVTGEYIIPALPVTPPEPEVTPTPSITYEVTDDAVIVTATGEGEVHLYVDGVEVDNPVVIARGNADVVVVVTATAQGEDMLISETATLEVTIPALEDAPEDPHMVGYWLVTIDKDGNEIWDPMVTGADNDGYQTNVALTYGIYGGFDIEGGAERPFVDFYVMIDGVRYACEVDATEPVYGDANENPLYENENFWMVPVGYKYVIGVVYDEISQSYFLQISKGTFVGVDEINAGKTVAGVRYFNMAGQEMQEANGVTIVVTTYTDGTTSATKVMK